MSFILSRRFVFQETFFFKFMHTLLCIQCMMVIFERDGEENLLFQSAVKGGC